MKAGKIGWALAVFVAIVGLCAAYFLHFHRSSIAAAFPESGLVNRTAHHQFDRALRASIHSFQERTQLGLGILLQDQIPPQTTIEEQAAASFSQLTQQGERPEAILLIWSEREHLFKIEVSYQLEGIFPDVLCRRLEESARTFMLSQNDFAMRDFLTEIIVTMGLHYLDFKRSGQLGEFELPTAAPSTAFHTRYFSGGAGFVGRGYAATMEQLRAMQASVTAAVLTPETALAMQPNAQIETVIQRYLQSLQMGLGSPHLPLITEGSRYYRMEKPHAAAYLQRMYRYYQKSQPYQVLQEGDLGFVKFPEGSPVQPILLRKNQDGNWMVDEAKAWAYFHLYEDGSSHPKFGRGPFSFAWQSQQSVYREHITPPALLASTQPLDQLILQAEEDLKSTPKDANAYIHLAELLQFELYWITAAAPLYEKALELEPGRLELHWRLIDIYANTTDIDGEERHYLALLKLTPDDALLQYYYQWFQTTYGTSN